MEQKTLTAFERTERRKGAARRARKMGRIPAVIYGSKEPHTISVDAHEFNKKFHKISENTIITLQTGSSSWDVLVKDFQEDILSGNVLHIDFYEIEQGKALKTHVPVHLEGTAPGVKEGGILQQRLHELEVECLPKDLPETISLSVDALAIGESVHVADIQPPEGVKILNLAEQVIVVITTPKAEAVEEEGEEEALLEGEETEAVEEEAEESAEE